jgi:PleD family two-component response regulator
MSSRQRPIESVTKALRRTRAQRALREQVRVLTNEARILESLAQTDDLTGLTNRRGWDEQLTRELARARRRTEPLSIALLNLNRFKAFNDVHGHQAGDQLLIAAAAAWHTELRAADSLCAGAATSLP